MYFSSSAHKLILFLCSQQRTDEPVTGCVGVPKRRTDYCVLAGPTTPAPTPEPTTPLPTPEPTSEFTLQTTFGGSGVPPTPLSECHGDCDDDTQCEGDLQCFQRYVY